MVWKIVELISGALIVGAIVIDVFGTIVVPGRVRIGLRLPSLVRRIALPGWRRTARLTGAGDRGTIASTFAAFLLFCVFASWVLLLMLGLALLMHALRDSFSPRLDGFGDALFQTGSAMMTLGLNGHDAHGWARLSVVLCGVTGLQVVTLTLTYIVQLQMALQQRDPLVLRLQCRAGAPPSGLQMLVTLKRLKLDHDIERGFERWEEWMAVLRQAHGAHPILIYFRSGEPHGDWVTAVGAVMDAASLMLAAVLDAPHGHAELLYRNGMKTIRQLGEMLHFGDPAEGEQDEAELEQAVKRLAGAGFNVRPMGEAVGELKRLRGRYAGSVAAMAQHFGVEFAKLVSNVDARPPDSGASTS